LDLQGLIKLVGGSRADLEAILEDFRSGATAQHAKLSAALAAGDRRAVMLTAHAIKGAAGYAGAKAIGAQAQALEAAAKRGVALEALAVRFETLTATMSGLPEAIAASLAAQFGEVG
jgi:HPt (histidine-containing phosphotransfer) domain-containing protein